MAACKLAGVHDRPRPSQYRPQGPVKLIITQHCHGLHGLGAWGTCGLNDAQLSCVVTVRAIVWKREARPEQSRIITCVDYLSTFSIYLTSNLDLDLDLDVGLCLRSLLLYVP